MKIDGIVIKNYRSIRNLDLRSLGNVNIFVGENSSGKSTVLNAIQLVANPTRKFSAESLQDIYHGKDESQVTLYFVMNDKFFRQLFNTLQYNNDKEVDTFIKEFKGDRNRSLHTKIFFRKFKKFVFEKIMNLETNIQKLGVQTMISRTSKTEKKQLVLSDNTVVSVNNQSHHDAIIECLLNNPVVIPDERGFLNEAAANQESISNSIFNVFINTLENESTTEIDTDIHNKLAKDLSIPEINLLMRNQLMEQSQRFLGSIKEIFQDYTDEYGIEWQFRDNLITPYDFKTIFTDNLNNSIDFLSIGSGTRSMYIITLLQAYFNLTSGSKGNTGVFLVEEPELYLYPKLEERIANIISDLTINNQIFITTHSANIVNSFRLEDITLVTKEQDQLGFYSKFSPLDDIQQVVDIFGFTITPFLNKKYVVFVEGPKDCNYYREIFKKYYPQNVDKVAFIYTGGIDKIHFGLSCQLIQSTDLNDKFLICCDSDWKSDKKISNILKEQVKNANSAIPKDKYDRYYYHTENSTNLETLFINYDLIVDTLGNRDQEIDDFILKYRHDIENAYREIPTQDWYEKIKSFYDNLEDMSSAEKFQFLRRYVFSKNLFKEFRNSLSSQDQAKLSQLMNIQGMQKEKISDLIPNLLAKFKHINEVVSV